MLDFQILFFQQVHAGSSYANPTQDLTSAATRGVDHATQIDKGEDHFNMSICHLDCSARHGWGNLEYFGFRPVYLKTKNRGLFCIIVLGRTSTSSISASSVTSSAKSRLVNTSFPKVTPAIPRCALCSQLQHMVHWS